MHSLLPSNLSFTKEGETFSAALNVDTGRVNVFKNALVGNSLEEHYESTNKSITDLSQRVHAALSEAVATQPPIARRTRNFVYMPTSRCNMGCTYCGQAHGSKNSPEEVDAAFLKRAMHAIQHPEINHVHVAWFGGEPLLAYRSIVALSERLVEAADSYQTRYSSKMTTNGHLLTPSRLQTLSEVCRVGRFDITVDGPEEIHNEHRPLKSGGKSYNNIMRTLESHRDSGQARSSIVVIRTNVDRRNVNAIPRYLNEIAARGFTDPRKFLIEISPVHSWGNDLTDTEIPTPEAAALEVEWMEIMESLGLPYGLLPGAKIETTCAATDPRSEVIGPDGTLFSCTETPLTQQADGDALGSIKTLPLSVVRPKGQYDDWGTAIGSGDLPCNSCDLRPVCGGACPKLWREGVVACPTIKLNFDQRMRIFMRRHGYISA